MRRVRQLRSALTVCVCVCVSVGLPPTWIMLGSMFLDVGVFAIQKMCAFKGIASDVGVISALVAAVF
jgi:hypothetical protein